jgi:hypothetical protein
MLAIKKLNMDIGVFSDYLYSKNTILSPSLIKFKPYSFDFAKTLK